MLARKALRLGSWLDRRTRVSARIAVTRRENAPKVLHLYSSIDNIGNILPALAIRDLVSAELTHFCCKKDQIPWQQVNSSFDAVVIGGAGLLHRSYEDFWNRFDKHNRLPYGIWGVGGCFADNDKESAVPPGKVKGVLQNADILDLRDDVTADHYGVSGARISPCPSVHHIRSRNQKRFLGNRTLWAIHKELLCDREIEEVRRAIRGGTSCRIYETDNIQRPWFGLQDILDRRYARVQRIVTSRLHGAIIASAMGVPYVALARDEKIRAFHRLFGHGYLVETVPELIEKLTESPVREWDVLADSEVLASAERVNTWLQSVSPEK